MRNTLPTNTTVFLLVSACCLAWNAELVAPLWQNPMPAKKTP